MLSPSKVLPRSHLQRSVLRNVVSQNSIPTQRFFKPHNAHGRFIGKSDSFLKNVSTALSSQKLVNPPTPVDVRRIVQLSQSDKGNLIVSQKDRENAQQAPQEKVGN